MCHNNSFSHHITDADVLSGGVKAHLARRWRQTAYTNLVLLHHLPDAAALLADDVAMQLVRHFDVLCYGHQRLEEKARLLLRKQRGNKRNRLDRVCH